MSKNPHIVIIGGGITGLSAAWEIQQSAGESIDVTLLESNGRWGGKILTQTMSSPEGGKFIIDAGPESFVTRKREIWDLTCELGLEDQIIDPGSEARGTYVLDNGKPIALPLSPGAFISTPLLTTRGKLRMAAEPFIARKSDQADESLADFVTRRLGREALDKFIGPVLGGIYNTNPDKQSILVTAPVMRQMEKEHRSLAIASAMRMFNRSGKKTDPNPPPSRFIGFEQGAEELVDTLVNQLDADCRLNAEVAHIKKTAVSFVITLRDGQQLDADVVICATPANAAVEMLKEAAPEAAALMAQIEHSHIGTISLAYHADDIQLAEPIRGLMIPRREKRRIDAVVWTSAKIPARTPPGYTLLRVFFGGGDPTTATIEEAELDTAVRSELRELLGITAEPIGYRLARWPNSYPQAGVGHLSLVAAIEAALPAGLFVTGSSYRGLAVPDCVRQGREAARQASLALTTINTKPIL